MNNEEICKRLDQLDSERKTLDYTYQLLERYIAPYRGKFFRNQSTEHEIDWRNRQIFDGTAVFDNHILANTIHSWLFPLGMKFFSLKFRNESLNNDQDHREWLDACTDIMHDALHQSNMNTESGEMILDKTTFGTGYLMEEFEGNELTGEGFNIVFSSIPVKEGYFEEDHLGGIYAFYRRLMWLPSQIISKFGMDKVPEKVKSNYDQSNTDRMEVAFVVYKNPDYDEENDNGVLPVEKRKFLAKYVLKENCESVGDTYGYYDFPIFLSRWAKTSESKYGHSPAMVALSDVLTLNRWKELGFRSAEKVIDPPLKTTQRGLLSDLDLAPAGLTVMRDINDIEPLNTMARFDVDAMKQDELKSDIHRAFYLDVLQLKDSPQMTAYEVAERTRIMQRTLGPVISRNKPSVLAPMIQRTFNAMFRFNKFPQMPEGLRGQEFDVVYTGPMAMSSKIDEIQTFERYLAIVGSVAEFKPDILDNIDSDGIANHLASEMSVDTQYLRSEQEVKAARRQQQAQQQAAIDAEQTKLEGEAAEAVGKGEQAMMGGQ